MTNITVMDAVDGSFHEYEDADYKIEGDKVTIGRNATSGAVRSEVIPMEPLAIFNWNHVAKIDFEKEE